MAIIKCQISLTISVILKSDILYVLRFFPHHLHFKIYCMKPYLCDVYRNIYNVIMISDIAVNSSSLSFLERVLLGIFLFLFLQRTNLYFLILLVITILTIHFHYFCVPFYILDIGGYLSH